MPMIRVTIEEEPRQRFMLNVEEIPDMLILPDNTKAWRMGQYASGIPSDYRFVRPRHVYTVLSSEMEPIPEGE